MKKYVREYRGCRVPVKATHFAEVTGYNHPAFYSDNHIWVIFEDSLHCHQNSCIPRNAIELPEAPQEWMPEVGEECEVMTGPFEWGKCTADYIGAEFIVYTANSGEGSSIKKFFRPLKTQQEKDREAFIARCVSLTKLNGSMSVEGFGIAYDDGARFTELKAGE